MKTHEIKLNEHFCDDVFVGNKNFEVRKNDRGYQKGDRVKFFPVLDIGVHFNHPIETALYEITYVLSNYEEICHYDIDNIKNAKDCSFFKDRSRFVELPCDIISKAEIKRELNAQCAVKKIDVETAKDMLENLPYIRVNTKQELKERETIPNNITPEATIIELNRCKVNGFMPVDVDRRVRAIERAKAALRKQVPMKVGYDDSMSPGFPAVRCGRCTELVEKEYSYCPSCGQALDWGE